MKTNQFFTAAVLATALFATGAAAQPSNQSAAPTMMPAPDEIIYLPQLPEPAELTSAAAAQRIAVERIIRTSAQEIVVYQGADGRPHTVAYRLLPGASGAPTAANPVPSVVPAAAATQPENEDVMAVPAAPATVVYAAPTPDYYYYDPFYYPWPWYGSVFYGIGLGYGYYGGGYRHFGTPGHRHFSGGPAYHHFGGGPGFYHSSGVPGGRPSGGNAGGQHSNGGDRGHHSGGDGGGHHR